jgi:Tol biopolymer transport system component
VTAVRKGVLICVVAALLMPATAAAVPSHAGKIAYTAGGEIWTVNPTGTGATNLTSSAGAETCALLSPGGAKIAFQRGSSIWVMNIDGSASARLPTQPSYLGYELWPAGCIEDWYPDGSAVTFKHDDHCDAGGVWNVYLDGRDMDQIACGSPCAYDTTPGDPDWAPDGHRLAVVGCPWLIEESDLAVVGWPAGTYTQLTNTSGADPSDWEHAPDFSPDGNTILFALNGGVYRINASGGGQMLLTTGASVPVWSPDGSQLAFSKGGDVWTMNPDGSNQVNLTNAPGADFGPVWSPDGRQLAFVSNRDGDDDVYVMNRDGSGVANVTDTSGPNERAIGWAQPTGYPRPRGASPLHVALVTAYARCAAPNRTHGPPLSFGSCNPPGKASQHLTVGTGDSNNRPARNEGFLRLVTIPGNIATLADEADVAIRFFSDDIFNLDLSDYAGELRASVPITITDQDNTPAPGAATTPSFDLRVDATCTPTADPQEGSVCQASTSADALLPGLIKEGRRTIWQTGQVVVHDGGPDGDAATVTGNTLFARQGVFVP